MGIKFPVTVGMEIATYYYESYRFGYVAKVTPKGQIVIRYTGIATDCRFDRNGVEMGSGARPPYRLVSVDEAKQAIALRGQ
jgi:hypothetical protein